MTIHSTCLPSGRRVTLYLPPGYDDHAASPYPLLLLHDGQNLFEAGRAYVPGEYWRIGETADVLTLAGRIPPMVIAGVDHAGPDRVFEFTPTKGVRGLGGGAADYAAMIVEEALPFLRGEYAVTGDPEMTGLGGSSLGGLVTLFIAASRPREFGRLLVMSPSVWWDHREILRILVAPAVALRAGQAPVAVAGAGTPHPPGMPHSPRPTPHPAFRTPRFPRLWLDIGLREGESTIRDARRLRRVLKRFEPSIDLRYLEEAEGDHSEHAWARRFPEALEFLFGRTETT